MGSAIQHGPHNSRIYVMRLYAGKVEKLIPELNRMAIDYGYGKIFAKIPSTHWAPFRAAGYIKEAVIPRFFKGRTDGLFVAKFFSAQRRKTAHRGNGDPVESKPETVADTGRPISLITACTLSDAETMANIYRRVFSSYPFPIHQPGHLAQAMDNDAFYFCIRIGGKMAAVAAAEVDSINQVCEMTDFATIPEYRGRGLAGTLLARLDSEARNHGVKTAYTIAREDSPAMNRAFKKQGYRFAGQLAQNSQIAGRLRDMLVWFKHL